MYVDPHICWFLMDRGGLAGPMRWLLDLYIFFKIRLVGWKTVFQNAVRGVLTADFHRFYIIAKISIIAKDNYNIGCMTYLHLFLCYQCFKIAKV